MNFAPSSLPLIYQLCPLATHPHQGLGETACQASSCIWWISEGQLRCAMLNPQILTEGKGSVAWVQQPQIYKQEVVDCLICMMTQIWLPCTYLQVLILWGSLMNSRGFRCYTIHLSDIMRNHPLYNDVASEMLRISRMWSISWNW